MAKDLVCPDPGCLQQREPQKTHSFCTKCAFFRANASDSWASQHDLSREDLGFCYSVWCQMRYKCSKKSADLFFFFFLLIFYTV